MADDRLKLPLPSQWRLTTQRSVVRCAEGLSRDANSEACTATLLKSTDTSVVAVIHVLVDLATQGWQLEVGDHSDIWISPPLAGPNAAAEKHRVRMQELIKRDEQLRSPSVRRFISSMERQREFHGRFVSITSLMRDGAALAHDLERIRSGRRGRNPETYRQVIDPYCQIITTGAACDYTGLLLTDIWRYFRHTWSNQYTSTPGRGLLILIRDRAAAFHPIIGIAALGSSIIQMGERDRWIGWDPDQFVRALADKPTSHVARWLMRRLEESRKELYIDDLIRDGLYRPSLWARPTEVAIAALGDEAARRRRSHHRFVRRSDFGWNVRDTDWRIRAESDLFRSKRCLALADILRARMSLRGFLEPRPTAAALSAALADRHARRAVISIIRRAKADSVGTEVADLTVCGAIAPYNALLGGKLVAMLAVSPTVVRAYHAKYANYASEIASSLAGRAIKRPSRLVFVGTTSLYGSGSSQYNRIRIPADVLSAQGPIVFRELGRSRSFGTSHLSAASVASLVRIAEEANTGQRINSIFGEGVNPKLRKVRQGLDLLGWPSEELLQHRRQRIIYGVSLVKNLLPYLLHVDHSPVYLFDNRRRGDQTAIASWWLARWLQPRAQSPEVLALVSTHSLGPQATHGARVTMPQQGADSEALLLFEDESF